MWNPFSYKKIQAVLFDKKLLLKLSVVESVPFGIPYRNLLNIIYLHSQLVRTELYYIGLAQQ